MATTVHFLDVGQGNMVLIQCSDGTNFMVDCNITEGNKEPRPQLYCQPARAERTSASVHLYPPGCRPYEGSPNTPQPVPCPGNVGH